MGRVISLKKPAGKLPPEGSSQEEALVSELYKKFMNITDKYHEVIVCKAVAVFMGTLMTKTETPGMVIGGFMKHIEAVANIAIAQHQKLEKRNAPKVYGTKHPEEGAQSNDQDPAQGSDRDLEVEERQEVLFPPTLQ